MEVEQIKSRMRDRLFNKAIESDKFKKELIGSLGFPWARISLQLLQRYSKHMQFSKKIPFVSRLAEKIYILLRNKV